MLPLLFSIFMGGLIGYATNTLAVEMLFRPFTPKYIGRWRLPFTPGLIPKEQGRIAESLGSLIETELFSPEVLSQALNTPETKAAISAWLDQLFAKAGASQKCPRELLIQTFGEEEYIQKREDLSSLLCSFFVQKATEAKLGESFARQLSHRTDKAIPFLPEGSLEDVYVNTLGKLIDRELEKSLPEIIQQYVYREAGAFLGTPLSLTLQKHEQELPKLKDSLLSFIHTAILGALPQLLGSGEIKRLVVDRINSLNPMELNRLLKGLMKKELAAIEWLGALLGGILGMLTYFAGKII
ncbi:MAG: DUF445 family protein [Clostridia bacterium]|nr:DUF445 family protein [Clostridia bacterium]